MGYYTNPEVVTVIGSTTSTYYCRTDHIHSSTNPWQQIFGGLSLGQNTDYLQKAHIWISSGYDNSTDGLAMVRNSNTEINIAAENYILTNATSNHIWLEMAHQFENNTFVQRAPLENTHWLTDYRNDDNTGQNRSWLINEVWTEILRMPSYKILADEYDCATMVG